MPFTEWKNSLVCLSTPKGANLQSYVFVVLDTNGFWPLALRDAGQPPLFLVSIHHIGAIEGPRLDSYPGIVFLILVLGMNLASTYCVWHPGPVIHGVMYRRTFVQKDT